MEVGGWTNMEEEARSRSGIVVEYEDWGGRGFNLVTEDCGPSRERARRRRAR